MEQYLPLPLGIKGIAIGESRYCLCISDSFYSISCLEAFTAMASATENNLHVKNKKEAGAAAH